MVGTARYQSISPNPEGDLVPVSTEFESKVPTPPPIISSDVGNNLSELCKLAIPLYTDLAGRTNAVFDRAVEMSMSLAFLASSIMLGTGWLLRRLINAEENSK